MSNFVQSVKSFFPQAKIFLAETRSEWKKVTKPGRTEVVQTTIVVVVTSFIFAVFLWASDFVIRGIYEWMFRVLGL